MILASRKPLLECGKPMGSDFGLRANGTHAFPQVLMATTRVDMATLLRMRTPGQKAAHTYMTIKSSNDLHRLLENFVVLRLLSLRNVAHLSQVLFCPSLTTVAMGRN